jgi:hypothetical protein
MFRVAVYDLASSPIHLDLEEGTLASEVIRKALQCLNLPDDQGNAEEGTLKGWNLRARRFVEEGRWWSEDDINEDSDRKFGNLLSGQADY